MPDTRFREQRWLRAGAAPTRLEELRKQHAELSPDEQAAEAARIDTVSDRDLAAELKAHVEELKDGTIEEVLTAVGDDPELAKVALAREQGRTGTGRNGPRTTLVEALEAVIAAHSDADESGG